MPHVAISPAQLKVLRDIVRREIEFGRAVSVDAYRSSTVNALRVAGLIDVRQDGTHRVERWRGYGQSKYRELSPPLPIFVATATDAGRALAKSEKHSSKPNAARLSDLAAASLRTGGVVIERDPRRLARARRAVESSTSVPSATFSYGDRGRVVTVVVWGPTREAGWSRDLWVIDGGRTREATLGDLPAPVQAVARRLRAVLRGE